MQEGFACIHIDLQAGRPHEIARGCIGLGAPDAVDGAIVEALAVQLALDIANDLHLAARDRGWRGYRLHRTRTRQYDRRLAHGLRTGREERRRMRAVLQKKRVDKYRQDGGRRH